MTIDMTNNRVPYGLLTDEEKAALEAHEKAGGEFSYIGGGGRRYLSKTWRINSIVRAVPLPKTQDVIAWEKLPDLAKKGEEDMSEPSGTDARLDRIEELEAKLAQAVEALAFYANEENYKGVSLTDPCGCCSSWYNPKIHIGGEDSGHIARAIIAEIEGEKG
jgi:hypothetical protein